MVDPIKLAPKKSATDEAREDSIAIFREALEMAERGEISEALVIARRVDGCWLNKRTTTINFCDWIGKLEITKQDWIRVYLDE